MLIFKLSASWFSRYFVNLILLSFSTSSCRRLLPPRLPPPPKTYLRLASTIAMLFLTFATFSLHICNTLLSNHGIIYLQITSAFPPNLQHFSLQTCNTFPSGNLLSSKPPKTVSTSQHNVVPNGAFSIHGGASGYTCDQRIN